MACPSSQNGSAAQSSITPPSLALLGILPLSRIPLEARCVPLSLPDKHWIHRTRNSQREEGELTQEAQRQGYSASQSPWEPSRPTETFSPEDKGPAFRPVL